MWFNNLLSKIGKWGGLSFLFGITLTAFMFGDNVSLPAYTYAYTLDTMSTNSYQPTEFMLDFNPTEKINDITAPVNNLINSAINGLRFGVSPSPIKSPSQQDIGFDKFFGSSRVSSGDIMSFLKEAAVTGINLTILVISITTQVLKGLLSVLK